MDVVVLTLDGPFIARHITPRDFPELLSQLDHISAAEISRGDAPPFDQGRATYARDEDSDCWQSAGVTARRGAGDCEDLSTYLAGSEQAAGRRASSVPFRTGPRSGHVLTLTGGVYRDPSVERGMPLKPPRWRLGRLNSGLWAADAAWLDSLDTRWRARTQAEDPGAALGALGDLVLGGTEADAVSAGMSALDIVSGGATRETAASVLDTVGSGIGTLIGGTVGGMIGDILGSGALEFLIGSGGERRTLAARWFAWMRKHIIGQESSGDLAADLTALIQKGRIPIFTGFNSGGGGGPQQLRQAIYRGMESVECFGVEFSSSEDRGILRSDLVLNAVVFNRDAFRADIRAEGEREADADPVARITRIVELATGNPATLSGLLAGAGFPGWVEWHPERLDAVDWRRFAVSICPPSVLEDAAVTLPASGSGTPGVAARARTGVVREAATVTPRIAQNQAAEAAAAAAVGRAALRDEWDAVRVLAQQLDAASTLRRVIRQLR